MANNMATNKIPKDIDIRYHMPRDYKDKGILKLKNISTEQNTENIVSKALDKL